MTGLGLQTGQRSRNENPRPPFGTPPFFFFSFSFFSFSSLFNIYISNLNQWFKMFPWFSFVSLATVSRTGRTQGRPVSEFVRFPCASCSLQWTRKLGAHVACALRSKRPRVALRVLSIQLRVLSTSNSASRHWRKDWNKTKGAFQNKTLYLKCLTRSLLWCVRLLGRQNMAVFGRRVPLSVCTLLTRLSGRHTPCQSTTTNKRCSHNEFSLKACCTGPVQTVYMAAKLEGEKDCSKQ